MNKYYLLNTLIVCSSMHAGETLYGKKVMATDTSMEDPAENKQAGALYSEYGLTKTLIVTDYSDDDELSKKRLTGVGIVPGTSWALIGTQKSGVVVVNFKNQKSSVFADKLRGSPYITSMASAFYTNRIAYTTGEEIVIGSFTPKSSSTYEYSLSSATLEDPVNTFVFDPTDSTVAGGCDDGSVRLWDVERAKSTFKIRALRTTALQSIIPILALAYLDNNTICYNSLSRGIVIHDLRSKEKTVYEDQHSGLVRALSTNIAHKLIVSGGADGIVRFFDVRQPKVIQESFPTSSNELRPPITSLAFHPSFQEFWVGREDGACFLKRTNNKIIAWGSRAGYHRAPVSAIAARDLAIGCCAISVGWDGGVKLYGSGIKPSKTSKKEEKQRLED